MVKHFFSDDTHNIYVLKNNKLIATVDIEVIKTGIPTNDRPVKRDGNKKCTS